MYIYIYIYIYICHICILMQEWIFNFKKHRFYFKTTPKVISDLKSFCRFELWIQKMKPFWRNFIFQCSSNRIKQSDWLGKFWSHRFFHYGLVGVVLPPISKRITKSTTIRVPTPNFYLLSLKILQPLLLL